MDVNNQVDGSNSGSRRKSHVCLPRNCRSAKNNVQKLSVALTYPLFFKLKVLLNFLNTKQNSFWNETRISRTVTGKLKYTVQRTGVVVLYCTCLDPAYRAPR
jgi:hypothetical protein